MSLLDDPAFLRPVPQGREFGRRRFERSLEMHLMSHQHVPKRHSVSAGPIRIGPALEYQWQVRDGDREVLCFKTMVDDREVEGVDLLRYGDDGLVAELVAMMRPLSGVTAVRDAMGVKLQELAAQSGAASPTQ